MIPASPKGARSCNDWYLEDWFSDDLSKLVRLLVSWSIFEIVSLRNQTLFCLHQSVFASYALCAVYCLQPYVELFSSNICPFACFSQLRKQYIKNGTLFCFFCFCFCFCFLFIIFVSRLALSALSTAGPCWFYIIPGMYVLSHLRKCFRETWTSFCLLYICALPFASVLLSSAGDGPDHEVGCVLVGQEAGEEDQAREHDRLRPV